jgi:glutamate racemase
VTDEKHKQGGVSERATPGYSPVAGGSAALPIGVFDSGVGGLTVLRSLREQLPQESFIYLGDTARLPYGTKSADSVIRYSLQAAEFLIGRGIKYLVVACNTASAVALGALRERFAPTPVLGVIEPGAIAGCAASRSGHLAVIATEGTVNGGAYQRAISVARPEARVVARACSLFVALAEEGWTQGPIVEGVAHRYLHDMFSTNDGPDTLVLGCTHFPVLVDALREVIGSHIAIVDSAQTTAAHLRRALRSQALLANHAVPSLALLATDSPERFARVGSRFLAQNFTASEVELVDLSAVRADG